MGSYAETVRFGIVVRDSGYWTPAQLDAAGDATDLDDWAIAQVREAMRAAGQAYIDDHPEMFTVGVLD